MIDLADLLPVLSGWLPRQRWYSGMAEPSALTIVEHSVEGDGWPVLVRLVLDADGGLYQVVVGLRARDQWPEFLRGQDRAVIGDLGTDLGDAVAYDAVVDPELAMLILAEVAPDESAARARLMSAEQSNSSLVYDERLILKLFRRVQRGHNPEVEVTRGLVDAGFTCVAEPLGTLRSGDFDLAILQPFLAGSVEGWALALTSLRDLFGMQDTSSIPVISFDAPPPGPDPGAAGGDFSGEATRLGEMTGGMHVALAAAFGSAPADAAAWAADIRGQLDKLGPADIDREAAGAVIDRLLDVDPGRCVRVHGDYHLGQVLRTDAGWYVLDFEGEPARPLEARRRPSSPLRDVAGMLRSFNYAAAVARTERDAEALVELALAWEERNRKAFLKGYLRAVDGHGIVPPDPAGVEAVLTAFEIEKAVYEVGYERAHRPDWDAIPLAALRRLTGAA